MEFLQRPAGVEVLVTALASPATSPLATTIPSHTYCQAREKKRTNNDSITIREHLGSGSSSEHSLLTFSESFKVVGSPPKSLQKPSGGWVKRIQGSRGEMGGGGEWRSGLNLL